MRGLFLTFVLLSFVVSCSQSRKTATDFSIELSGALTLSNTLVIFGKSTKGDRFSRVVYANSGSVREEIPFGVWTFGAVSWEGSKAFTGTIKCDFPAPVTIGAEAATVNLKLINSNCFSAGVAKGGTNTGSAFYALTPNLCQGDVSSQGATQCSYSPTIRPIVKGFVGSYKLVIPSGRTYSGVSSTDAEYIESSCYNAQSNNDPAGSPTYFGTELNVPAFLDTVGFPMQVHAYLGSACESAKGVLVRNFPAEASIDTFTPGGNYLHISAAPLAVCTIAKNLVTPNTTSPAAGNGTLGSPWLICTEEQLLAVQTNFQNTWSPTAVKDGVYVLGKDMDLIRFIKGGDLAALQSSCLEVGDTFVPIGKTYAACALSNNAPSSSFHFDGNGHTIKNFRFKDSSQSQVGFFSAVTGKIYDVSFENADVEGGYQTGAAIGSLTGGTAKMIKVIKSRVQGDNETGGIVGNVAGTSVVYELHASRMEVEGLSQLGGVVGKDTTTPLNDLSFDGTVYARSGATFQVGGIVGSLGSTLDRAVSSGAIRGSVTSMGGIAGSGGTITNTRSTAIVKDLNTNVSGVRNIGGIAGMASAIQRSFFAGSIKSLCVTGCDIGSLTGNASTATDSFTLNVYQIGNGVSGPAVPIALMRSAASTFKNDLNNLAGSPAWTQVDRDFPRLAFETNRPCANTADNNTVAAQSSTRGTSTNPITICREDQLGDLELVPAGSFVNLKQDIYISSFNGVPTFTGHFNGEGRILHSYFTADDSVGTPLIDAIATNSSFSDVILSNFKISKTSSCPGCFEAGLAGTNEGTISKVSVEELSIDADSASNEIAGLVHENKSTGTISLSSVDGELKNHSYVGGIAYKNSGTIKYSTVHAKIDLKSAIATNVGGIAGINSGSILRSRFKGQIENMAGSSISIGGIVGFLMYNTSAAKVIDNEVDSQASIILSSGVSDSGGVVGYSDNVNNVFARNINNGFVYNQGAGSTVKALLGDGFFTDVVNGTSAPSKAIATDYLTTSQTFDAPLSTSVVNSNTCNLIINSDTTGYGNFGALWIQNEGYYTGPMVEAATIYTLTVNMKSSRCSAINGTPAGNLAFYRANNPPDTVTPASLKLLTYDLVDFINITADRDRAIASYVQMLKGVFSDDAPVWISDEEGIGLFHHD